MTYSIPSTTLETTLVVKKSLFHARAGFADSREAALALLSQCKIDYPDARHHCWAYLLGDPAMPRSVAMSDDGEPSGTAGKPILNVLQHKTVGNVMVVVSRYFGGIKLGAGGLVRAYSASTQQTMQQLATKEMINLLHAEVVSDFKHEQYLRHFLTSHNGSVKNCEYSQHVVLKITLPIEHQTALRECAAKINAAVKLA